MSENFTEEVKKTFENVETLLNALMKDRAVPRNIKRIAQKCVEEIHKGGDSPGIIASNAIYYLGDVTNDPNLPFHSRTTLYRIISLLETIKD
jgi:uncharacterized protein (UPF0147 family)